MQRPLTCVHILVLFLQGVAVRDTYYDTLGLSPHATPREIKRAYRRLALEWHPDKNDHAMAAERFRMITEAYQVLSDPFQKSEYDSLGISEFGSRGIKFSSAQAQDIFNSFFGHSDLFGTFVRMKFESAKASTRMHDRSSPCDFDEASSEQGLCTSASKRSKHYDPTPPAPDMGVNVDQHDKADDKSHDASSSSSDDGLEFGDENDLEGCFDVQILDNVEPQDGTVIHVEGSACCNGFPFPKPTNLLGCCQRCAHSVQCDLFNWDSNTGTCWLLGLKVDTLETNSASNRKMGLRPWEVGDDVDLEGCFNARIQKNIQPRDGTFKHASGSACCNVFPNRKTIDLLGCCQRCVKSRQCEAFIWKPSTGLCWLFYFVTASRDTDEASDRYMGYNPTHALA